MDKQLLMKLKGEQSLTAEEALRLDGALEGESGVRAAKLVAALPEETPSLAWRSALNERLGKVSRRRRTTSFLGFGLVGGAAVAACVFVAVTVFRPEPPSQTPSRTVVENVKRGSLEDAIMAEHQDAMSEASLGVHASYDGSRL